MSLRIDDKKLQIKYIIGIFFRMIQEWDKVHVAIDKTKLVMYCNKLLIYAWWFNVFSLEFVYLNVLNKDFLFRKVYVLI